MTRLEIFAYPVTGCGISESPKLREGLIRGSAAGSPSDREVDSMLIGTSGYHYRDWIGPVYPPGSSSKNFLEMYSRMFSYVEINSSYYKVPSRRSMESIAGRCPPGFSLGIKLPAGFTHGSHDLSRDQIAGITREFLEAIEPLRESALLVAVLAQFPYSFHYTNANRRYLDWACAMLEEMLNNPRSASGQVPVYLEFRGDDWFSPGVYRGIGQRGLNPVLADTPELPGLPGELRAGKYRELLHHWVSGLAESGSGPGGLYMRFHGHNGQQWWTGSVVSRYDYLYTARELEGLQTEIREILEITTPSGLQSGIKSLPLIMAFNNHHRGQAVQNARDLALLLGIDTTAGHQPS